VDSRTLEDVLGTQIFLKLGIAILVIGVVFAMGLVFQKVGPLGKVFMGYAGGIGLLLGGLAAEKRERYQTFGRTLIAGAWGILYFVTFAAGFLEPSRILTDKLAALAALILAAGAAVAFSLRYRNEWTTTSAFLLIFLSLFIAASDGQPAFNLAATLIVAAGMAILIWRTGWMRLLALGVPATWIALAAWTLQAKPSSIELGHLLGLAACWLAFQIALLGQEDDPDRYSWQAFAQIANFVGALGLTLQLSVPLDAAWGWAAIYGLLHLGIAALYFRRGSRGLYLLTATEAIAALALVTPLRLGLRNQLTPLMRLLGIELVLAAGVFLKERYFRLLAYGAFTLTGLEILVFRLDPGQGEARLVLLGAAAGLALLNAGLLRTRWREACEDELPAMTYTFTSLGALLLTVLIGIRMPGPWRGAAFAGLALLWILLGVRRGLKDLMVQGAILGLVAFFALLNVATVLPDESYVRLPATAIGAILLLLGYLVTRRGEWREALVSWHRAVAQIFAFLMNAALILLVVQEAPKAAVAPLLAAMALVLLLLSLRSALHELFWQCLLASSMALITLGTHTPAQAGGHLGLRTASMAAVALGFLFQETLLRRWEDAWPWSETARSLVGHGWGILGALLLAILSFLDVPAPWLPLALMALAVLWMAWARWRASGLHCVEALGFAFLSFTAIFTSAWSLSGSWHGLPLRSVAIFPALLLAYGLQYLLHRSGQERRPGVLLLSDRIDADTLTRLGAGLLLVLSFLLGLAIKVEGLAHGKNLLVALAWGLLGILYLERGRSLRTWSWILYGHVGLLAALVHFLGVNVLQPGAIGPLSLRLITGVPFLGMLVYAYWNWEELDEVAGAPAGASEWRHVYLYGLELAVAMLVLYEAHRAWVLPLWALQALISLPWGLRRENRHALRSALILILACTVRTFGTNLAFRDQVGTLGLNLVTVPLAAVLILIGYVVLRREIEGPAVPELVGLGAGSSRIPWLLAQTILWIAFIWVEASGTELTVWLSALGLGLVALGFVFQERLARLMGLGFLSSCILKLFFYDLRGLSGLPRVFSFIVLGLVLVVVSFVYTRFKERLEKLL